MENLSKNTPRAKVFEIMSLAINVSQNTPHDVFVKYSGHVRLLSVNLYEGGWGMTKEGKDILNGYLQNEHWTVTDKELDQCIRKLKILLIDQ